jgi:hypothetical protein
MTDELTDCLKATGVYLRLLHRNGFPSCLARIDAAVTGRGDAMEAARYVVEGTSHLNGASIERLRELVL